MSVNAKVKEITHNVKGTSKAGKDYTYTKFVYETDTGEAKTKQLFKADVLEGVSVGDNVEIFFKKNDKGFFDLVSVQKVSSAVAGAKQAVRATTVYSDKDVEIEVMNALNVAGAICKEGCSTDHLLNHAKEILAAKSSLVEYAKSVRSGNKDVSDDPFKGIS